MPGGAGREDYSPMPVGGSGASRGRQDREGSGYYDRPANRARLQNQQARINQMQSRGEGIFGRPAKQSFLSGIGKKFKDWAGNMRGGINPLTNEYYTQEEYKDNVQARRDRARIDRIRKTKDLYDTGVIDRDWDQSPLKNRLAGLEEGQWNRMNAMGMPIGTTKPGEEVTEEMIYPERKPDPTGINAAIPAGWMANPEILRGLDAEQYARTQPETISSEIDYNIPIQERISGASGVDQENIALANYFGKPELEAAGAAPGTLWGGNKAAEAFQDYYDYATNPRNKSWMKQGITTPEELRKKGMQGAGLPTFPDKSTMEFLQDYPGYFNDPRDWLGGFQDTSDEPWPVQTSPNELLGIARGGIIGAF